MKQKRAHPLRALLRADCSLLWRHGIAAVYLLLMLFYTAALRFLVPDGMRQRLTALLLLTDPATLSLFFMGAIVLYEKNQHIYPALYAAGVRARTCALSKCIVMSLLGTFVGCAVMWFSSCMVALEERDNGVCLALVTTPLGKAGYLASRFLLPALFAALYSALCAAAFSSVPRPLSHTVMLSLPAAFTALTMVAFIPAFARDKIVGMAMSKLCGLLMLTVAIPFFLPYKWQPLLCWLPSYWFYRFLMNTDRLMAVMCLLTGLAWLAPLVRRFSRRALR